MKKGALLVAPGVGMIPHELIGTAHVQEHTQLQKMNWSHGRLDDIRRDPKPVVILIAVVTVYVVLWPLSHFDIDHWMAPWLRHIASQGPISALSKPFGDYAPPYYYLLAIVSPARLVMPDTCVVKLAAVIATTLLVFCVRRLLLALKAEDHERRMLWLLLLPSILFNAVLSASCDALWAAPSVLAVAMAVDNRNKTMLVWCGVALSIKAQAIFLAPFVIAILIARKIPVYLWLIAPVCALMMYLPAILCGWPVENVLTVYLRQAGFFEQLSVNGPNIPAIVQLIPGIDAVMFGQIFGVSAVVASIGLIVWFSRRSFPPLLLVAAATLTVLVVVGLLPRMHERYFYLADVLVFAYAVASSRRSAWIDAALVQLGSTLGIAAHLTAKPVLAAIGGVMMLIAAIRIFLVLVADKESGLGEDVALSPS